jgi:hypothetical protein
MAKPVPFDDSLAVGRGITRMHRAGNPLDGYWSTGEVILATGATVSIYRQGGPGEGPMKRDAGPITRLDYVHRGRVHMRTFQHWYSDRGLRRIARQFVADVRGW